MNKECKRLKDVINTLTILDKAFGNILLETPIYFNVSKINGTFSLQITEKN